MTRKRLILASSSPYRRELLQRLMIPFDVVSPDIDETPRAGETAPDLVLRLALQKAAAVAEREPDAAVIGSDQVAVHENGEIVGKPVDEADAVRQLTRASGQTVTLYTGLALIDGASGTTQSAVVPYAVTFKTLSPRRIERYLAKERPFGCSGSLRADGLGIALLAQFEGADPTALIGLPLIRLVSMLEAAGIHPV